MGGRATVEGHSYWVFNDPEFLKDLYDSLIKDVERPKDYFRKKYFISQAEVQEFVISGVDESRPPGRGVFAIKHQRDRKVITVDFPENITKQDYLDGWKLLKWYKDKRLFISTTTKRKPPVYSKLIYAIFRARNSKNPLTFKQIFMLYQNKELPLYEGGLNSAFNSEDSLERYYNKHKPVIPDA